MRDLRPIPAQQDSTSWLKDSTLLRSACARCSVGCRLCSAEHKRASCRAMPAASTTRGELHASCCRLRQSVHRQCTIILAPDVPAQTGQRLRSPIQQASDTFRQRVQLQLVAVTHELRACRAQRAACSVHTGQAQPTGRRTEWATRQAKHSGRHQPCRAQWQGRQQPQTASCSCAPHRQVGAACTGCTILQCTRTCPNRLVHCRASPVQHSPSSSGLGMAELLDQLDRATGRIHVSVNAKPCMR